MVESKRNIPFADLKPVNGMIREDLIACFADTLDKEWFIGGEKVKEFEDKFAKYCNAKYCVGVGNGLESIELQRKKHGGKTVFHNQNGGRKRTNQAFGESAR